MQYKYQTTLLLVATFCELQQWRIDSEPVVGNLNSCVLTIITIASLVITYRNLCFKFCYCFTQECYLFGLSSGNVNNWVILYDCSL